MDEKLMDRIIKLCKANYPVHNWEGHLMPVVDISLRLCEEHKADRGIIEPAAYLHDIGRVKVFDYLKIIGIGHEVSGYHYSLFKLWQYGCMDETRERIARCVLEHCGTGLSKYSPTSLEAEIVMNADAIASFDQYLYLVAIFYASHGRDLKKTKEWVLGKLKRDWETKLTLSGVKEEIEPGYKRIKNELTNIPKNNWMYGGSDGVAKLQESFHQQPIGGKGK